MGVLIIQQEMLDHELCYSYNGNQIQLTLAVQLLSYLIIWLIPTDIAGRRSKKAYTAIGR